MHDLCETVCNTDPTCRGQFTYLDPKDGSKTCFHCTGKGKNPDIDKPISPFPLLTDDVIQDLKICYDDNELKQKECSWNDLTEREQKSISDKYKECSWNDLTDEEQKSISDRYKECSWDDLGENKINNLLRDRCEWSYMNDDRRTSILNSRCKWKNLSEVDKKSISDTHTNNAKSKFKSSWGDLSTTDKEKALENNPNSSTLMFNMGVKYLNVDTVLKEIKTILN